MSKIVKEYTPGPWECKKDAYYVTAPNAPVPQGGRELDRYTYEVSQFGGMMICESVMDVPTRRLISAAPELVEALIHSIKSRCVVAYLQSKPTDFDDLKTMADFVNANWAQSATNEERTALAKAGILVQ